MSNTQAPPLNLPPGVSIERNIAEAQQYAQTHSPADTLLWFRDQVRSNGPWDYKRQGPQYEELGNWNYGAVGTALGIPADVLRRMAGLIQIVSGTSRIPEWKTPVTAYPYGDDPEDQRAIDRGIEWSRVNGHEGPSLFSNGPIRLPMSWALEGWDSVDPYGIDPMVNTAFNDARAVVPRRDPLGIDLDADGIETIGITTTPISSTTTAMARQRPPAGYRATTPGSCWTATATAPSTRAPSSSAPTR
jgi:hypothetical protein